jgi:hypothetical protein
MKGQGMRASAALLIVAVALLVVAGCGGDTAGQVEQTAPRTPAERKMVKFLTDVGLPGINETMDQLIAGLRHNLKGRQTGDMDEWNAAMTHYKRVDATMDRLLRKWNKTKSGGKRLFKAEDDFVALYNRTVAVLNVVHKIQNGGPYAADVKKNTQKAAATTKAWRRAFGRVEDDLATFLTQTH